MSVSLRSNVSDQTCVSLAALISCTLTRTVSALAVYDDGSGPALYAGGYFSLGQSLYPTTYIARFDGVSWSIPGDFR